MHCCRRRNLVRNKTTADLLGGTTHAREENVDINEGIDTLSLCSFDSIVLLL